MPTLRAPAPYLPVGQMERLPRLPDILTRLEPKALTSRLRHPPRSAWQNGPHTHVRTLRNMN